MIKIAAAFLCAAVVLMPSVASAVTLALAGSGYKNVDLGGNFDLIGAGVGAGDTVQVLYAVDQDPTNGLYLDGPADVKYTYLGTEAGFTNRLKFAAGGTTIFQSKTSLLGTGSAFGDTSTQFNVSPGLLAFLLTSNDGNPETNSDTNYVANNGGASPNMNIAYYMLSSTSWLVLLDDFGAGPDRDYDDIGIRIDVAAVPLPAALPLLGAGLGALGALAWRKKRAQAQLA